MRLMSLDEMRRELKEKFLILFNHARTCDSLVAAYAEAKAYQHGQNVMCSILDHLKADKELRESCWEGHRAARGTAESIEGALIPKCFKHKPDDVIKIILLPEYAEEFAKLYEEENEVAKEGPKELKVSPEMEEALKRVQRKYIPEIWK